MQLSRGTLPRQDKQEQKPASDQATTVKQFRASISRVGSYEIKRHEVGAWCTRSQLLETAAEGVCLLPSPLSSTSLLLIFLMSIRIMRVAVSVPNTCLPGGSSYLYSQHSGG